PKAAAPAAPAATAPTLTLFFSPLVIFSPSCEPVFSPLEAIPLSCLSISFCIPFVRGEIVTHACASSIPATSAPPDLEFHAQQLGELAGWDFRPAVLLLSRLLHSRARNRFRAIPALRAVLGLKPHKNIREVNEICCEVFLYSPQ